MASVIGSSGLKVMTICAALSVAGSLALAGETIVSADQIVRALQPKPIARGIVVVQPEMDQAAKTKEVNFIDTLRNRKTRLLSPDERQEIATIASTKPKIDLEIQFDYNSADISRTSVAAVKELGKALSNPALKGSTFVVAGHTDGVGGDAFNQELSERRADTVKRYLADHFGINGSDLITVGYGKSRLKDAQNPTAAVNRRVEVVNMETKTAQK